jgi:hypothetical protein
VEVKMYNTPNSNLLCGGKNILHTIYVIQITTSSRTSGFWSLSKTIAQKPEDDPTTMKANLARLPQTSVRYVHKIIEPNSWRGVLNTTLCDEVCQ